MYSERYNEYMRNNIIQIASKCNVEIREYQIRIIEHTLDKLINKNANSVMIEAPVGSGKTIIGLLIIKYLEEFHGGNFGWVAMRKNLLRQVERENTQKNINTRIQTISMFAKDVSRLGVCDILIDECQHDSTVSMTSLHNQIQPRWIIGLSGTPFRADRVKLCFETQISSSALGYGIYNLIHEGYLSEYNHWTIPDWDVNTVVDFYCRDKEKWGKSLIYFHTIEKCRLAEMLLKRQGIKCTSIFGGVDIEPEIDTFREGHYDVVLNCMMLTEGFDFPELNTVFARPSYKGTTIQMCGRVFRKFPGIKYKNIVQPKETPWPFMKTAMPENMFIWSEDQWKSLKAKTEKIETAYENSVRGLAAIEVKLPKLIRQAKKERRGRRFGRGLS